MITSETGKPKEDLNDQIIQAARKLFQTYGLHKVTMDDIGKLIGKHRSSLYHYYKSKEEVFDAVKHAEINEVITDIVKKTASAPEIEKKIYAFCEVLLSISQKKRSIYTMLDVEIGDVELTAYATIKQSLHKRFTEKQESLLHSILNEGIAGGQLPPTDENSLLNLVFILISSLHGLRREMSIVNDFSRITAIAKILSEMILHQLRK